MKENMVDWSLNWKKIGIPFFRANAIRVKVSGFSSGYFLSNVMKQMSSIEQIYKHRSFKSKLQLKLNSNVDTNIMW